MLPLDRSARVFNPLLQQTVMLGLAVGTARLIVGEHREIIRDDRVIMLVAPFPSRHFASVRRLPARVITVI
jgi:hypothetical protein